MAGDATPPDALRAQRRRSLGQMQSIALALLLGAALLYALGTALTPRHAVWGYVAAFGEAGMVGAVADWFAVVALFRHPLGLPIPHTAIVPANKNRLGESLAGFLCQHFLATPQVLPRLQALDVPTRLADWLCRPDHAARVADWTRSAARWALGALGDARVRAFAQDLARRGLRHIDIAPLAGQVLDGLTHEGRHQRLLDAVIVQLAHLLGDEQMQQQATQAIAREIKALRYVGLDQTVARMATEKLIQAIARTLLDMVHEPAHPLRERFDRAVRDFVERLKTDPELHQRLRQWRDDLLLHPALGDYVQTLWSELLAWLAQDLGRTDSALGTVVAQAAQGLGERLRGDDAVRAWLQRELLAAAPAFIDRYRDDIRAYIVARVHAWDAQDLSRELELHIGRDLQFIRINGTLVGGSVGLLIHAVTQALAWMTK